MIHDQKFRKRVREAISEINSGKMVIMVDDEDRENEGDLVFAASDVTPEKINFMATHAKGLICLSLNQEVASNLDLHPVRNSQHIKKSTAFTNSIEAREGVTTGISAADRSHTIAVAIDDASKASDLVTPGHVFPLVARSGGVLERTGHTEGSVDLVKLAHKKPAAVICEIMNADGTMARRDDLEKFSKEFDIKIVSVADIVAYRLEMDQLITEISREKIDFEGRTFYFTEIFSDIDQQTHYVISTHEKFAPDNVVNVRVHRQNSKKDLLNAFSGHGPFHMGLQMAQKSEHGIFIYLNTGKETLNPSPMFFKAYGLGAQILNHFHVKQMNVFTRSEIKLGSLDGFGLTINDTRNLESI